MSRRVSVAELRANLAGLLGAVHDGNEPVVVELEGKAFAVLISPQDYERLQDTANGIPRDQANEVSADATAARERSRDGRHLAGAWSDLDWDEFADELDRIRHESKPTPIIEIDDL